MLVLTRKLGEQIRIAENIVVTVLAIHGDRVKLGLSAPLEVAIHREEVYKRLCAHSVESQLIDRVPAAFAAEAVLS